MTAGSEKPRLGMHVSITGGMAVMAGRARDLGCEAVQIFSRSPRGGKARPLGPEEVAEARRVLEAAGIGPLVIHMPYFANLCAGDDGLRAYAVETLTGELERAAVLGAPFVVTHLGRPAEGVSLEEALRLAEESVRASFEGASPATAGVRLLLENTAGAGREIGADLGELDEILGRLEKSCGERLGVCLDTCHAHAAGYDLGTPEGAAGFASQAGKLFGPGRIRAVHANDALGEAGKHKDRHAQIGQGTIGETGFRALLVEPLLSECPFLLETPGTDEERAQGLARLKHIRAGGTL